MKPGGVTSAVSSDKKSIKCQKGKEKNGDKNLSYQQTLDSKSKSKVSSYSNVGLQSLLQESNHKGEPKSTLSTVQKKIADPKSPNSLAEDKYAPIEIMS